ncbi:MAG TPA: N-methyl-L-tryptophan oxidase [Bryobacteraceae bacterium]|nr:N-methyl-L-tryptophan oxidase [Bryobacteraceae bacterium]
MYDVIIVGLGGMGSAAAYHLAARRTRVLGLEKFSAAHNRGSSHGDSRIIRQAYHENPGYVPLAQRAYQLWQRLEHDANTSILRQTGGLMIGPPGSSVVKGTILSATQHNLPFQVLNADEIRRRFPALHPRPNDTAVYEAVAGYLRPETAIHAHLQLASKHGAELRFQEPVNEWAASGSGDRVVVKTAAAAYEAARLIIAPGAWASELLGDLQIPFDVRRHVMCWFQPADNENGFQPDQFPIYIWDVDGHHCFYGFPATGNAADGVKAAMHSGGRPCTASNIDREISDGDVADVRDHLERFIPSLNGPLLRAATCMYTLTPDQHFVVAIHPRHPQVCVAAGFSGHGFKFTSVMGEILAGLAIDGRTDYPIDFLSPARFSQ